MVRKRLLSLCAAGSLFIEIPRCEVGSSLGDEADPDPPAVDWRVLPSARGRILDRNGVALAYDRAALDIYVVPRLFSADARTRLIALLGLSEAEAAEMDGRIARAVSATAGRAVLVLADQERGRAELVAAARGELGGAVEVHEDTVRVYPHGPLAAHLVGYLGRPVPAGSPEPDRREAELVGRHGIEAGLESSLRGRDGIERFIVSGGGERMAESVTEALIGGPSVEPPVSGHDVVLTVDIELQKLAEKSVARHAAAVVVAEVQTGRILALASTPAFDPGAMSRDATGAEQERLAGDPRRPHLDRTLAESYPAGSTFKLVTAIAGLEDGVASRDEELTCTGQRTVGARVLRDMHVHGKVDFIEALQVSCNVYFWAIAERVGLDRMAEVARDLGFGEPTGLGINGDVPGRVPAGPGSGDPDRDLVSTLSAAIGGGQVRVTAIQMAMAYAAVANGGRLYAPQVVRRVQTADGRPVEEHEPALRRTLAVQPSTLEIVRQGMWRAVNSRGGTAHPARRGAVPMGGKTGTAPPAGPRPPGAAALPGWDPSRPHAWFVAWAPWDRPEIVVVVLVEHGGVGGAVAAPIARTIVDGTFARRRARGAAHQPP